MDNHELRIVPAGDYHEELADISNVARLVLYCPCGWAFDCPADRSDLINDYFDSHA